MVDELVSHLADVYAAERDRGRSDEDATAAALRLLEGAAYSEVAATRRAVASPSRLIDRAPRFDRLGADLAFDVRYALRGMRRQVAVSTAIVAILATGIGATTAVYAAIECLLIRALPYPNASQLVMLKRVTPTEESGAFSPADWLDYAARHRSTLSLAAYASWPMNLTGTGEPERLRSVIVSGEFFQVAASNPALGRVAIVQDDSPSAPAVVVLGHGFWTRRFGANPSVVGTHIVLNDRVATVVGVMGPAFALPDGSVDLWMPMGLAPQVLADRAGGWLSLIGRLKPGITPAAAQAELAVTSAGLHASEGPVVYVPYAQKSLPFLNWLGIVARTSGRVASAGALKDAILSVDSNQPVQAIRPMAEYVAREAAPYRFGSLVAGSLAAAALVLAVTGIYGLTAFVVGGRSRELALRMVLGATPTAAAMVVLRHVAIVFGAGAVAGLAGSVVTNGLLRAALAGGARSGRDVSAALVACLLMSLSAALAALGPALRAARLDPRRALQAE